MRFIRFLNILLARSCSPEDLFAAQARLLRVRNASPWFKDIGEVICRIIERALGTYLRIAFAAADTTLLSSPEFVQAVPVRESASKKSHAFCLPPETQFSSNCLLRFRARSSSWQNKHNTKKSLPRPVMRSMDRYQALGEYSDWFIKHSIDAVAELSNRTR